MHHNGQRTGAHLDDGRRLTTLLGNVHVDEANGVLGAEGRLHDSSWLDASSLHDGTKFLRLVARAVARVATRGHWAVGAAGDTTAEDGGNGAGKQEEGGLKA